jgi:adenylate cyclase class 2
MRRAGSGPEIEVKLRLEDLSSIRRALRRAGFRLRRRRTFESNLVFDTPELALRRAGKLLRLREVDRERLLTYKGPPEAGRHKRREEIDVAVQDAPALRALLERLGYQVVFRYEKYRTEYHRPDEEGVVTIDETPIGNFLEIEGAPEWIDRTASELGFEARDYITASYGRLFLEYARRQPNPPAHMVFPPEP